MKTIAYDTETTGLDREVNKVFAYSKCDEYLDSDVVRIDGKDNSSPRKSLMLMKKLFSERGINKHEFVMHNAKFDIGMTERAVGRKFAENLTFHDTIMQSHILQNDHPNHKLKNLGWELVGIPVDDESKIKPYTKSSDGEIDYSQVPAHLMHEYQVRDAERTMMLHLMMYPEIQKNSQWLECYENELALSVTTLRMEERGLMIHKKRTMQLRDKLARRSEKIIDKTFEMYGKRMNLENNNVIREILYTDLKMPVLQRTKKSKQPAVDKEALAELREINPHPVLDLIQAYKSWTRGVTMLESYMKSADANDVIHPDIRTCSAITGRESCCKPNLQNIEAEGKLLNPFPVPARLCFRPRPGFVHFHIDYKGIEFGIAVNETGDDTLIKWVEDGVDLHVEGVSRLLGDVWDNADEKEQKILRTAGKNANFGKMFGGGRNKVFAALGRKADLDGWARYDQVFSALTHSARRITKEARDYGYVTTIFGRRLHVQRNKPYKGINYKIQGAAAGVLKRSQVRVANYLMEATGGEAQIILPIHDEIIIEFPRNRLKDAHGILREVRRIMLDFPMFRAPLEISIEIATRDWSHKRKFELKK